jgi:uncharacterized protein YndB with AHSA1/START domain
VRDYSNKGGKAPAMTDRVERDLELDAPVEDVWEAVTTDGFIADQVSLELEPGGEASFDERTGWVEEALAPVRLTFWWSSGDEPASRVELRLEPLDGDRTCLRVTETRPLDRLELIGVPVTRIGGARFGPALVAS